VPLLLGRGRGGATWGRTAGACLLLLLAARVPLQWVWRNQRSWPLQDMFFTGVRVEWCVGACACVCVLAHGHTHKRTGWPHHTKCSAGLTRASSACPPLPPAPHPDTPHLHTPRPTPHQALPPTSVCVCVCACMCAYVRVCECVCNPPTFASSARRLTSSMCVSSASCRRPPAPHPDAPRPARPSPPPVCVCVCACVRVCECVCNPPTFASSARRLTSSMCVSSASRRKSARSAASADPRLAVAMSHRLQWFPWIKLRVRVAMSLRLQWFPRVSLLLLCSIGWVQ